jgi:hypothetical protein
VGLTLSDLSLQVALSRLMGFRGRCRQRLRVFGPLFRRG